MKHTAKPVEFASELARDVQYTYVTSIGNSIYARGRKHDGAPVFVEQKYAPVYYLPTREGDHDARGFDGTPLASRMCDNLKEGREFLEEHPGAFGNIQPEYMLLSDVFGGDEAPHDTERLYIWFTDIEVDRDPERGYAPVEDPFNPVTAITVIWTHMGKTGVVAYGTGDYVPKENETYIKCDDEADLLRKFLFDMRAGGDYPDVISGWNVQFYDMPYLVNRCKRIFDEKMWKRISPFERLADRTVILGGRQQSVIDIRGIAILDYYELYRKFVLKMFENYKLDFIASVEIGAKKVNYKEHRSLDKLYREDHQKFIEYNIQDVRLVIGLDQKRKLIDLVCALGYSAKVNFVDTFKQVRLWDVMIYHKLRSLGKQIPPRDEKEKNEQYAGAYVKDPLVGMHKWVVSFDVASMYPHIIREWNLSPETLIKQVALGSVDDFLNKRVDTSGYGSMAIAANGVLTRTDEEGFLPNMLKTLYEERSKFKKLAQGVKKQINTEQDPERKKQLQKQYAAYDNAQQVRKVNLNSAYGALGSNYFRFYDTRLAEAVTITGQLTIRWVAKALNDYLNRTFRTDNRDYIIASDTDSVYIRLDVVADAYAQGKNTPPTIKETVAMFDKFCNSKLQKVIEDSLQELADYLHVFNPCLSMAREVIADKGVWTAKKRYILNVWNMEGADLSEPDLKVMGIEAVKSSTPAVCRDMLKKSMKILMNGTQQELWDYVANAHDEFCKAPFEDVAFPRSVNGLKKYAHQEKGVPIQVRGAQAFNNALVKFQLTREYEPIHEGEKTKFSYLRVPNPFHSNVISAPGNCPTEFNIEKWVDYETQWEKAFVEPLNTILGCAGWTLKYEASLFD